MQFALLKRREFITLLGGATAWPFVARPQQPKIPVIGFFYLTSLELARENLANFRRGLGETGYIEDRNVAIEPTTGSPLPIQDVSTWRRAG